MQSCRDSDAEWCVEDANTPLWEALQAPGADVLTLTLVLTLTPPTTVALLMIMSLVMMLTLTLILTLTRCEP